MAASSQSEDVLDLDQVSLEEAPLPPPIQRVMDPGQFTHLSCMVFLPHWDQKTSDCPVSAGFSDLDVAAVNPDAADFADKLDLSVSSIDMTNTSLAMQEEKESEISGVGECEAAASHSFTTDDWVQTLTFVFPVMQRSWRTACSPPRQKLRWSPSS